MLLNGWFWSNGFGLNAPGPPTVPPWDLALVLRALSLPPFKPLQSARLREFSLKTILLHALVSAKHVEDIHVLSIDAAYMWFGPKDCSVTLKPALRYVPGSLSTPFGAQVISLSAFSSDLPVSQDYGQRALCRVQALRIYIERSASFRQSEQLFVCYGRPAKGHSVSKQRLSHWIRDTIALAYACQGVDC